MLGALLGIVHTFYLKCKHDSQGPWQSVCHHLIPRSSENRFCSFLVSEKSITMQINEVQMAIQIGTGVIEHRRKKL